LADTWPRSKDLDHPERISFTRNEVTPTGPDKIRRNAVRQTGARAGTRSLKKQRPPAVRQRETGRTGPDGLTRKGADVREAPEDRNDRRPANVAVSWIRLEASVPPSGTRMSFVQP
jgi:hypothetical protein